MLWGLDLRLIRVWEAWFRVWVEGLLLETHSIEFANTSAGKMARIRQGTYIQTRFWILRAGAPLQAPQSPYPGPHAPETTMSRPRFASGNSGPSVYDSCCGVTPRKTVIPDVSTKIPHWITMNNGDPRQSVKPTFEIHSKDLLHRTL